MNRTVIVWLFLSIAGLVFLIISPSRPETILAAPQISFLHVDGATGSDTATCGSTTQPCRTIQGAINISTDGDIIRVAAGTYQDSRTCLNSIPVVACVLNRHLTILGGYTNSNWNTADPVVNPTIIDGQNMRRVMQLWGIDSSSASLTIQGFTIQNGYAQGASNGGDEQTFAFGGGLIADRGQFIARDMIFKNNVAVGGNSSSAYGGAVGGGALALRANPAGTILENIVFDGNQARGGTGPERGGLAIGGGLYTFDAQLSGNNLTFTNNLAIAGSSNGNGNSGGLKADAQGGGAAFQKDSIVTLFNITATGNQAIGGNAPNGNAGGAFGGGVFAELATISLENITLRANSAVGGNGRNPNTDGSLGEGGGIALGRSNSTINRAIIVNNLAQGGNGTIFEGASGGGGVYSERFSGSTRTIFINSIIANNATSTGSGSAVGGGGGGYFANADDVTLLHTTIANNQIDSTGMQGSGFVIINGGSATISESIVANHTGQIAVHAQPSNNVSLTNNLFFNNNENTGGGGTFSGVGTIFSGNPNFVSPNAPNYNYHIGAGSAAINQADNTGTAVDIDNQIRGAFGLQDVGADEYAPIVLWATSGDGTLILNWEADLALLSGLSRFDIVISPEAGASPPNEGSSPINTGTQTSFTLTGLTNNKDYTISIMALDGSGSEIDSSNTLVVFPTDDIVYVPIIIK